MQEGKRQLKNYLSKAKNNNLNMIFFTNYYSNIYDLLVIKCSAERLDFHTITYITANSKKFLGEKPTKFLGVDLDEILPEPLQQFHKELWSPNIQCGNLLVKGRFLDVYVKNVDGYICPCKLAVRIDYNLVKGLSYVGYLNFNKTPEMNNPGMITDIDGKILNTTFNLSHIFEVGENIIEFNKELPTVYRSLNEVVSHKFDCYNFGRNFQNLAKDPELIDHFKNYVNWSAFKTIDFNVKGRIVRARIKIKDYLIFQLGKCLRFIEMNLYNLSSVSNCLPELQSVTENPQDQKVFIDMLKFYGHIGNDVVQEKKNISFDTKDTVLEATCFDLDKYGTHSSLFPKDKSINKINLSKLSITHRGNKDSSSRLLSEESHESFYQSKKNKESRFSERKIKPSERINSLGINYKSDQLIIKKEFLDNEGKNNAKKYFTENCQASPIIKKKALKLKKKVTIFEGKPGHDLNEDELDGSKKLIQCHEFQAKSLMKSCNEKKSNPTNTESVTSKDMTEKDSQKKICEKSSTKKEKVDVNKVFKIKKTVTMNDGTSRKSKFYKKNTRDDSENNFGYDDSFISNSDKESKSP